MQFENLVGVILNLRGKLSSIYTDPNHSYSERGKVVGFNYAERNNKRNSSNPTAGRHRAMKRIGEVLSDIEKFLGTGDLNNLAACGELGAFITKHNQTMSAIDGSIGELSAQLKTTDADYDYSSFDASIQEIKEKIDSERDADKAMMLAIGKNVDLAFDSILKILQMGRKDKVYDEKLWGAIKSFKVTEFVEDMGAPLDESTFERVNVNAITRKLDNELSVAYQATELKLKQLEFDRNIKTATSEAAKAAAEQQRQVLEDKERDLQKAKDEIRELEQDREQQLETRSILSTSSRRSTRSTASTVTGGGDYDRQHRQIKEDLFGLTFASLYNTLKLTAGLYNQADLVLKSENNGMMMKRCFGKTFAANHSEKEVAAMAERISALATAIQVAAEKWNGELLFGTTSVEKIMEEAQQTAKAHGFDDLKEYPKFLSTDFLYEIGGYKDYPKNCGYGYLALPVEESENLDLVADQATRVRERSQKLCQMSKDKKFRKALSFLLCPKFMGGEAKFLQEHSEQAKIMRDAAEEQLGKGHEKEESKTPAKEYGDRVTFQTPGSAK